MYIKLYRCQFPGCDIVVVIQDVTKGVGEWVRGIQGLSVLLLLITTAHESVIISK